MANRYKHWCPNGCGKKAMYISHTLGVYCEVCKKTIAKDLKDLKEKEGK